MTTPRNNSPSARTASRWDWHREALLRTQERLLREKEEHTQAIRAPLERDGEDAVDLATRKTERDTLLAEIHLEEAELAEVQAALERIRNGTYGICEMTGQPISAARLRAIPWARLSHRAAQQQKSPRAH